MAVKKIEDWAGNLPEVGVPIIVRVDEINKLKREVTQLKERAAKERVALRGRVIAMWTPNEIKAARNAK